MTSEDAIERTTNEYKLFEALVKAGLRRDLPAVLGSKYLFNCNRGSHFTILSGTIESIEFSDEVGLQLYVSSPSFCGAPLDSFVHESADTWTFRLLGNTERFRGTLKILN
jgi:hypothetical protein